MHNYPSDITREQFEIIRPDLEAAKIKTRPRKYDLYDIFCAVLYILRGVVANVAKRFSELEVSLLLLHSVVKA